MSHQQCSPAQADGFVFRPQISLRCLSALFGRVPSPRVVQDEDTGDTDKTLSGAEWMESLLRVAVLKYPETPRVCVTV